MRKFGSVEDEKGRTMTQTFEFCHLLSGGISTDEILFRLHIKLSTFFRSKFRLNCKFMYLGLV